MIFIKIEHFSRKTLIFFGGYFLFLCFICFSFVHGDLILNCFVSNQVEWSHLNVYKWFSSNPTLNKIETPMAPLYYLTNGAYIGFLKLLNINPISKNDLTIYGLTQGFKYGIGGFLLKIPNIIALFVGAFYVYKIARKKGLNPQVVVTLWLTSPIILAGGFMQGQLDIIPATLTMVALYYVVEERFYIVLVMLGLSAAFKNYALLLIPPFAIILGQRDYWKVVRLTIVGVGVYGLTLLPFWGDALVTRLFGWKDDNALFDRAFMQGLTPTYPYFLIYFFLVFYIFSLKIKREEIFWYVSWVSAAIIADIFCTTWWLPQWCIWMVPFCIFIAIKTWMTFLCFITVSCIIVINNLIYFTRNLDSAMLEPWFGHGIKDMPFTYQLQGHIPGLLYTILITLLVLFFVLVLKNKNEMDELSQNPTVKFLLTCSFPIVFYVAMIFVQPFLYFEGSKIQNNLILPTETKNILSAIDQIKNKEDYIEMRGWAFIDGKNLDGKQKYIVLSSNKKTYILSTKLEKRPDVTTHFKKANYDDSGYKAIIIKDQINPGVYRIGFFISGKKENAFTLTDARVEIK
ncbi:glycosyltransferase family 87 protein [Aneurinibacillus terranovensis]|uniref:glycosyltransferase family 87 protein n=1 Tax=Aneurinibacillus terranovensis TaxID=278991 RepID=UPI0003F55C53|nr:glycosyltransferase family 87 protein [Aneurinibacillus terranovensis]